MQVRFVKVEEALEGLTADKQLEVASQLTMATLKAARDRFEDSSGDWTTYDSLCETGEEWFTSEIEPLRFDRVQ